jgi:hypothetical protein
MLNVGTAALGCPAGAQLDRFPQAATPVNAFSISENRSILSAREVGFSVSFCTTLAAGILAAPGEVL